MDIMETNLSGPAVAFVVLIINQIYLNFVYFFLENILRGISEKKSIRFWNILHLCEVQSLFCRTKILDTKNDDLMIKRSIEKAQLKIRYFSKTKRQFVIQLDMNNTHSTHTHTTYIQFVNICEFRENIVPFEFQSYNMGNQSPTANLNLRKPIKEKNDQIISISIHTQLQSACKQ